MDVQRAKSSQDIPEEPRYQGFIIFLFFNLVAPCELLVAACGIYFPDQGSNLGPLHWEHRVLSTVPPGKSLKPLLRFKVIIINTM